MIRQIFVILPSWKFLECFLVSVLYFCFSHLNIKPLMPLKYTISVFQRDPKMYSVSYPVSFASLARRINSSWCVTSLHNHNLFPSVLKDCCNDCFIKPSKWEPCPHLTKRQIGGAIELIELLPRYPLCTHVQHTNTHTWHNNADVALVDLPLDCGFMMMLQLGLDFQHINSCSHTPAPETWKNTVDE